MLQPLFAELATAGLAVAHNGNLDQRLTLRRELVRKAPLPVDLRYRGYPPSGGALAEAAHRRALYRCATRPRGRLFAGRHDNKKLIGARDPLAYGPDPRELKGSYILCSETCALDIIGARFVRESRMAEVIVISDEGVESSGPSHACRRGRASSNMSFSRPDSILGGAQSMRCASSSAASSPGAPAMSMSSSRCRIRRARRTRLSQQAKVPFELASSANHYVGRTFIEPTPDHSRLGRQAQAQRHRAVIQRKRVLLVDDSIVRRHDLRQDRAHDV